MQTKKGKLIVIEGTDGSGKATQAKLLVDKLEKSGHKVVKLSLPQYGKKSAGPTEEYLAGRYGRTGEVDPYTASALYAVDHFDLAQEIKRLLAEEYIVIMDRYVDSNVGHQGGKIADPDQRTKFIDWLYDFEYDRLGIPRPDIVLILHVPANMSQQLALARQKELGKVADTHETDLDHLQNAEKSYLWLARRFPADHKLIECVQDNQLLRPEQIHELVWQQLFHIVS